jgi:hypothetical protein
MVVTKKINSTETFIKYKNILAILGFVIMIIFTITDPTGHGENHGFFVKLFGVLLPLGTSSLVWNKWLYNGLVSEPNTTYSKITYRGFILFAFFLILFFDIGMIIGLCHYFC